MEHAVNLIFRQHSQAARHSYRTSLQLLDVDMTGLPCGRAAELSTKGYFARAGIRYGRQVGRVTAAHYQEIVVDRLFPGNIQLRTALRSLVEAAEATLGLDEYRRSCTVLRFDAGGGTLEDVNWCLGRGYQLHGKDISSARAESWAATVREWFDDPQHPGRQLGWVVPQDTPDYARSVKRLAIRWRRRNDKMAYALLLSTLEPSEVITLLGETHRHAYAPNLIALAYAKLYDRRGGAIEIEIKEDKQGFGMTKRRKKRAEAQRMVMLLNMLAHNLLVWTREWLAAVNPKLARYGILRLVRDVCSISGRVEINTDDKVTNIILNRGSTLARQVVAAFEKLLSPLAINISLA